MNRTDREAPLEEPSPILADNEENLETFTPPLESQLLELDEFISSFFAIDNVERNKEFLPSNNLEKMETSTDSLSEHDLDNFDIASAWKEIKPLLGNSKE